MDNIEAYDHLQIKLSLYPLDKNNTYESRQEDQNINKLLKPMIFENRMDYVGKPHFTPVATPLKISEVRRIESVMKTPFSNEKNVFFKKY